MNTEDGTRHGGQRTVYNVLTPDTQQFFHLKILAVNEPLDDLWRIYPCSVVPLDLPLLEALRCL
jgi:hypothetical protein